MDRSQTAERKIALIRDNLVRLRELARMDLATFQGDFRNIDSAEHRLQISIQALVDLCAIVVAARGLTAPERSIDLIEELHRAGLFPVERRDTYLRMVRFRNVLVHVYNSVDVAKVYEILRTHLDDIQRFLDDLLNALPPASAP